MHITKFGQQIFEDSNLGTLIDPCYNPRGFNLERGDTFKHTHCKNIEITLIEM
jgi:hypothetical protein